MLKESTSYFLSDNLNTDKFQFQNVNRHCLNTVQICEHVCNTVLKF